MNMTVEEKIKRLEKLLKELEEYKQEQESAILALKVEVIKVLYGK